MKISINQPAYLPWLGYFDRIIQSDLHIVLDHVQFEKNSMVNRNKIYSHNGELLLSVPVKTSGLFKDLPINGVQISNNQWQKKHFQSIYFNYKKAKYFNQYIESLENIYQQNWTSLSSLLNTQLLFFTQAFNIKTKIITSSTMNLTKKKSDLVLEICKEVGATHYLSGPFGRDYLDEASFDREGVKLSYQDYIHPTYKQFSNTFLSHLSALDLLMHHGERSVKIITERLKY